MIRTTPHPTIDELRRELDTLEHRLADGELRIEQAVAIGADTAAWEEFWLELLRSYESVYRRLELLSTEDPSIAA